MIPMTPTINCKANWCYHLLADTGWHLMLSPTSADVQERGAFWVMPQKGIKLSLTLLIPHYWTGRVHFVAEKKLEIYFHAHPFTTVEPCWIPQINFSTSAMPGCHVEYSSSNKWWYSIQWEPTII